MSLAFLAPVEHLGRKFDRAMTLYEFSALREPERTQFPQIGAWLRAKGVEFNEVPTPQMLWKGRLWPDLFIANQLEAVPDDCLPDLRMTYQTRAAKHKWHDALTFEACSLSHHGDAFHEAFIEPMCRKIAGRSSSEIAAKYHRTLWLPLYWPQTLRSRKSIPTPFFYPVAGYAGEVRRLLSGGVSVQNAALLGNDGRSERRAEPVDYDTCDIQVAYVVAATRLHFSVAFIVDDSPIYRITDQDSCAGIETPHHRLIVEYRGECSPLAELVRLGFIGPNDNKIAYGSARLQLPTLANVAKGWTPRPHINNQLWELMNAS